MMDDRKFSKSVGIAFMAKACKSKNLGRAICPITILLNFHVVKVRILCELMLGV